MRYYETGFLIAANLSEEEAAKIIHQVTEVITQKNGRVLKEEKWGKRKLAYPIKRFQEAFYVFISYEGDAQIPFELARRFRQMETILRYLTTKRDEKDNVRRRKKVEPGVTEESPEEKFTQLDKVKEKEK